MNMESIEYLNEEDEMIERLNLMELSSLLMKEVSENVYEIEVPTKFYDLYGLYKELKEKIIKRKHQIGDTDIELDIQDLHMVRTMEELPEDLYYHSLIRAGAYIHLNNPFFPNHFFGHSTELEEFKIVSPVYRDTVHFALNGLVSNTIGTEKFTNRDIVVIEPLLNHINDKLVNINPLDTIIDVGEEDEKIGENAVFIISKDYYENLSEEERNRLKKYKVVLFDYKKLFSSSRRNHHTDSPLQIITDFVLCSMGILPQHSIGQSVMHSESIKNYELSTPQQQVFYQDEKYLKKFTDLIERLNIEHLGISYYNVETELAKKRRVGQLGNFHFDLLQWKEELEENRRITKDTFKRYMEFLNERIHFPDDFIESAISKYNKYIDFMYDNNGQSGYLLSFPKEMWEQYTSIEEIKRLTIEFNENELSRLASIREKYQMIEQTQEESEILGANKR